MIEKPIVLMTVVISYDLILCFLFAFMLPLYMLWQVKAQTTQIQRCDILLYMIS